MKQLFYILIVLTVFAAGCKKKALQTTEFRELTINSPESIGAATFTLTNVDDNRCPINANCITAGKASINIEAVQAGSTQSIKLCVGGDCRQNGISDKSEFKLAKTNYIVRLLEVFPFPDLTTVALPKKVKVEIIRN